MSALIRQPLFIVGVLVLATIIGVLLVPPGWKTVIVAAAYVLMMLVSTELWRRAVAATEQQAEECKADAAHAVHEALILKRHYQAVLAELRRYDPDGATEAAEAIRADLIQKVRLP